MKSKLVAFHSVKGGFQMLETEIPLLKENEILVRNEFTTLCRSDVYTFWGIRKEKDPTILGHEIVGRVAKIFNNKQIFDLRGDEIKIGDRITWAIFASDPNSEKSKMGIPQKSADLFKYGHEEITDDNNLHGGLSEYIILRKYTPFLKISENIPVEVAAIINCAVATVAGSIRLAGEVSGKNILISGTGMLGIIAVAMASTLKAKNIIVVDKKDERIQAAIQFGAKETLLIEKGEQDWNELYKNKYGKPCNVDCVIDFSGSPDAIESAIETLTIGGTAILIGSTFPQRKIAIDAEQVVRKIISIKGLHNYNLEDFLNAVQFIENYHATFPFSSLINNTYFDLDTVAEAFRTALDGQYFRVGVYTCFKD
ncbi:MAG: alcohol dehydrogenase [Chitinophagia bacterium]|nr:alcohol dehydrogenase [Chitinophagia bacterium]